MRRNDFVTIGTMACLATAMACNDPAVADRARIRAEQAQQRANVTVAGARGEALRALDDARAGAQAAADSTGEAFSQARAEYRDKAREELRDVDGKIAALQTREAEVEGKARADVLASLRDLDAKRAVLERDLRVIDTSTAAAWDAVKQRVDADVDAVKRAADAAGKKI